MFVSGLQNYSTKVGAVQTDVYFDDVTMRYTPTNIIQYNEYYPYGLQTNTSWTRDNTTGNNFLGNGGTEINTTTGWYDLLRNYDPTIGRFMQVDPLATLYASFSGYHYSFNNPVMFNDPSGANPYDDQNNPTGCIYCNDGPTSLDRMYDMWYATTGPSDGAMARAYNDFASFWKANGGDDLYNDYKDRRARLGSGSSGGMGFKTTAEVIAYADALLSGVIMLREVEVRATRFSDYGTIFSGEAYWGKTWLNERLDAASTTYGERLAGRLKEDYHTGLDMVGLIPGLGEVADGINALSYAAEGDYVNSGLSTAGMIPFLGWGATGAKYANKIADVSKLSDTKKALKEVHEILDGPLPKGSPGKFGSPQRGTSVKGYRLDPAHPNRPLGDPESVPHINYWDYTNGKRGNGGISGAIPIGGL